MKYTIFIPNLFTMFGLYMFVFIFLLQDALAEYPSSTPKGAMSVYQSFGFGQWSQYRARGDAEATPNPIQTIFSQSSIRYGVAQNFDLEFSLPILHSTFGDQDPVSGIGFVQVASKISLLREGESPITFSLKPAIRVGTLHAEQRGELHNIGEGTIDLGIGAALGRLEYVGTGFYWFDMGVRYWHRIPASFVLTDPPAPDLTFDMNIGYSFHPSFGLSGTLEGIHRLGGQDFPATVDQSIDQWAALQVTQLKTGGRVSYFATEKLTFDLIGLRSVFAINNPVDELYIGIGINYFQPPSR